ncbi:ABC transporter permease [Pseudochryseolinea flava]|uniref:ABC transporter permease n=1 Tax=Pseudochryseolinea flava TaxID=2059302 RepID=A0A364XU76_9BACT|nr:ABC transporter permease [Pseudochryseolinea flava]RAV97869.1 ABC transporter permease [Pseudochryseolinea flava]
MFLKTFIRTLRKNTFFSLLNIVGLALGMSVFLLVALYVQFEKSYESFNPNATTTYRITLETYLNNERVFSSAENYPEVANVIKELPEVEDVTRLYNLGYKNNVIITNEEATPQPIAFKQRKFLYADSSFLSLMGYTLSAGDINTALSEPHSTVLTKQSAERYFGKENPIGKMLRMRDDDGNDELVRVTGVVNETPLNTHLKFDILFSYKTLFARTANNATVASTTARFDHSWGRNDMYTYVRLVRGTDVADFESKLADLERNTNPEAKQSGERNVLKLQPLNDIHLTSKLTDEAEPNSDERIVSFSALIGLFVLAIAFINYINLSTAQAMERAREVGVRKIMGAVKRQLILQFLTEAACVNLASLLLAYALIGLALPLFNTIAGLPLTIHFLIQPWFISLLLILWVSGTLLSGFYPALVLSSFHPMSIVKGRMKNSIRGVMMRKSLVVFQFMASVALIAGTLIVFRQLDHMLKKDLGMNMSQVLVVERPSIGPRQDGFISAFEQFRNTVKGHSAIESLSMSGTVPGKQREYKVSLKRYGASDDQLITTRINSMDYEFMDVYQMKILAGRVFSEAYPKDRDTAVVITESASRLLGFATPQDAIGQTLTIPDWTSPIVVGVVNDYHQVSLKSKMDPALFYCDVTEGEYYSMRINGTAVDDAVRTVEAAWKKSFPGNPFEYFFLDDYFNSQYKNEQRFGMLFTTFSVLALIIGCLGLLGLSAYTTIQRTKEIGIRKVLGSSETGIFSLLSMEYIKLIGIASLLAIPIVYFLMHQWIENFPYRTTISPVVFMIAGSAVLIIALLTVSIQTIRAARANPVKALRSE